MLPVCNLPPILGLSMPVLQAIPFLVLAGMLVVLALSYWWSRRTSPADNRSSTSGDNSGGYIPGVTDSGGHEHHHSPGCGHGHDGGSSGGGDSGGGDGGGGSD